MNRTIYCHLLYVNYIIITGLSTSTIVRVC